MSGRAIRAGFALCLGVLLAGCSMTPRASGMRIDDYRAPQPQPHRVVVHVEGGGPAEWHVHDPAFRKALVGSLVDARVFSAIVDAPGGELRLDAVLGDLRQPVGGLNEPTVMTVLWSVSRVDSRETVWQELVETTGHSANFVGAWRIRNAAEEAAQRNIERALALLSEADLSGGDR